MTGRKKLCLGGILFLAFLTAPGVGSLPAAEVAGVNLPDRVTVEGSEESLILNGAGVRKKLFVKVYAGGLYLPAKTNDVGQILSGPGARRVVMHFLYKEVETEKLVAGWNEGFAANLSDAEFKAVAERLERFNGLFRTAHSGDVYELDLVPEQATVVRLNGKELGRVSGEDFYRALLKVWLGDKPGDKALKKALLGR